MSAELEHAKTLVANGRYKKALSTLWVVEAKARNNLDEAQGLLNVAAAVREHLGGRALADCVRLVELVRTVTARLADDPRTGALVVVRDCRMLPTLKDGVLVRGIGLDIEPTEDDHLDLIFHQDEVRITHRDRLVAIPYADLTALEVGAPAVGYGERAGASVKSGVVRVGTTAVLGTFGLPLLWIKAGTDTVFAIQTGSADILMLSRSDVKPDEWRQRMSAVFSRVQAVAGDAEPASASTAPATKVCPDCAETILRDARVCKHCGYRFAPPPRPRADPLD